MTLKKAWKIGWNEVERNGFSASIQRPFWHTQQRETKFAMMKPNPL